MLEAYPIAPPMARPVYSNIAFTLFIYALQAQTGKDYRTLVQEVISRTFEHARHLPPRPGMTPSP